MNVVFVCIFISLISSRSYSHQKLNFNMIDIDLIARVYPYDDKKEHIGNAFSTSSYYAAPLFLPTSHRLHMLMASEGQLSHQTTSMSRIITTSHASSSGSVTSHGLTAASSLARTRTATWSYQIAKASATTNSP